MTTYKVKITQYDGDSGLEVPVFLGDEFEDGIRGFAFMAVGNDNKQAVTCIQNLSTVDMAALFSAANTDVFERAAIMSAIAKVNRKHVQEEEGEDFGPQ